jgi:enamine deaminase RidA (YjgF/YER057c/UK114 family)
MDRKLISSGAPWEQTVGYSRAVKVGSFIAVAGTTAVDEQGTVIGQGDAYRQTVFIIEKIQQALHEAGATLMDVVRTRMFVTNIDDWEAIGKAHGAFFRDIRPAATMVEVSRLINPDLLIEMEVDAIVSP